MGSPNPFGYLTHKLWPKEGPGVKLPIWLPPQFSTYCWKALDISYNFVSNLTSIGGLHTKLWASKSGGISIWEFQDSNLGVLGQNDIWVLAPWLGTKNIIRGKVVASPKSGSWWILWVHVCSWLVRAPKMLQLCI
jgi:hypothetical protein